LVENLIYT